MGGSFDKQEVYGPWKSKIGFQHSIKLGKHKNRCFPTFGNGSDHPRVQNQYEYENQYESGVNGLIHCVQK